VTTNGPTSSYNDGVTTVGATFMSPSARFTAADVGTCITGGTIGANSCITAVSSYTQVTLSVGATTAAKGVAFTLDSRGKTTRSDGVANGTTTYTSASGAFTSFDVGKPISGANIPAGAKIASVTNSTTISLSAAATAGTGLTFTLNAFAIPAPVTTTDGTVTSQVVSGLTPTSNTGYTFTVVGLNNANVGYGAMTDPAYPS